MLLVPDYPAAHEVLAYLSNAGTDGHPPPIPASARVLQRVDPEQELLRLLPAAWRISMNVKLAGHLKAKRPSYGHQMTVIHARAVLVVEERAQGHSRA